MNSEGRHKMDKRQIWDYPKATLKTKYGDREMAATSNDHVHVTHPGYENGTAIGFGPIRGVTYHVSAHLHRRASGEWKIGPHDGWGFNYERIGERPTYKTDKEASDASANEYKQRDENHGSLYATRMGGKYEDASYPARLVIGKEIEQAFNEWIKTDEAIALFDEAQEKNLRRELESATEEMNETFAAYQVAEKKANKANEALTEYLDEKEGVKA
jgi:hypothetical protein